MAKYSGKVVFVNENFGASKLAEKFGVNAYPAVFVDDVLVAKPRDFGFFGGEKTGRYAPWLKAEGQEKFKADLTRMIDLILAGKKNEVERERAGDRGGSELIASLPKFTLSDLSGRPLRSDQAVGRTVLVEFWATWCPPCRSTLEWLGKVKQKYNDNLVIVALAVDSPADQVRATVAQLSPDLRWAMADSTTAVAFGDVLAVPTMFLFDRTGKTVRVFYGAPPGLHEQAEKTIASVVNSRALEPSTDRK